MKQSGKQRICQALRVLADGKPVSSVSIVDLIAEARVNRSTFYYHFSGTQQVLEYMMEDFCRNYLDTLSIPAGQTANTLGGKHQEALERRVCQYIAATGPSVQFFLQEQNYHLFYRQFCQQFQDYCQRHQIVQIHPDGRSEPLKRGTLYDYYVHSLCLQLFGILECWAKRNFSETEEDFIQIFNTLHNSTITIQG